MLSIPKANSDEVHAVAPEILRAAAVDLAVLASYEKIQLDGEPDLIVELIDLYLEDAPRRVAVMRESLAKRNWLSVKHEAHSLRGSSGNLGALQIALICDEMEGLNSGDLFPSMEALLSCLEPELERVVHIFLAERQRRLQ
jgi:HPt (histidine-containing phosphotransfer) domain-containing protein